EAGERVLNGDHLTAALVGEDDAVERVGEVVAGVRQADAAVEPQLVLDQAAADVEAGVADEIEVALGDDGAALAADDLAATLELAGGIEGPHTAMELVGAALGDGVDDTAGGPAVLGHEPAGLDAHLLDELDREAGAVETEA